MIWLFGQTLECGRESILTQVNTFGIQRILPKISSRLRKASSKAIWIASSVLRLLKRPTFFSVRLRYPVKLCLNETSIIMPLSFVEGNGTLTMKQHSAICRGCVVMLVGNSQITIGERSCVGDYSSLLSWGEGNITIGSNVQIASYCHIVSKRTLVNKDDSLSAVGVDTSIGDGTWIGSNVTIIDGVTIGRNVIIGAKSLVNCSIPDNAIAYGIPAKVVRLRDTSGVG